MKASINIGHGSGDPAGFPNFKPLNPWGRPMPKAPPKPELPSHQLFVEQFNPWGVKEIVALGPKASEDFLLPLKGAIEEQIALGNEKHFRNPHIVRLLLRG